MTEPATPPAWSAEQIQAEIKRQRHFEAGQRLLDDKLGTDVADAWARSAGMLEQLLADLHQEDQTLRDEIDDLRAALAEREQEIATLKAGRQYPHWQCRTHGRFDATVAVGCPECVREQRQEIERLRQAQT